MQKEVTKPRVLRCSLLSDRGEPAAFVLSCYLLVYMLGGYLTVPSLGPCSAPSLCPLVDVYCTRARAHTHCRLCPHSLSLTLSGLSAGDPVLNRK